MNGFIKTFVVLLPLIITINASAYISNNDFDTFDLNMYAEFDKSASTILSGNSIKFPYKNAVIGLRGTADYNQYGKLHLQLGGAYGPIDIAMDPYKISGYVGIESIGYGYTYPIIFKNSPWSVDFKIDKTSNKYTGYKLNGSKNNVIADDTSLNATSEFIKTGLGLKYQVNQSLSFTIGAGMVNWDIGASAVGTVEAGIDATEEASLMSSPETGDFSNLHGKDDYYFIETKLPIMDEMVTIGYRRTNITAKNQTFIDGFYADATLVSF